MRAAVTKTDVFEALRPVKDPELGYSIVDLGLIYDAEITDDGKCTVRYTLTSPTCPLSDVFEKNLRDALATIPGLTGVALQLTFDPPWNPENIAEPVKRELRLMGLSV